MTMLVNSVAREHLHQFLDHYSNLTADDRHNRFFSTMGPSAIRDWMTSITKHPYSHLFFVLSNQDCRRLFDKLGFTCNYSSEQQCLIGHLDLENP